VKLLVLGGTAFLGRAIAAHAMASGHDVTCLARGTNGDAAKGVRLLRADRDTQGVFDEVRGRRWDAVVDVARQPGHVRRAVLALEPVADRYLFVSTANVYASQAELGADEDADLLPALDGDVMESMEHYGQAKVACEQAVSAAFGPQRHLIARAGLIGGPGDLSGRSGYWPWRFAHPSNPLGTVLVPQAPGQPVQMIDVRDLASWLVTCAESRTSGIYNAGANRRPLAEYLAIAQVVAGHAGRLRAVSTEWLKERGVQNWAGPRSLPLWIDDVEWYGMNARDTSRAEAAGLRTRPLEETLRDALRWEDALESHPHGAGLSDDEERELLGV
jgi:nucleoside-diphosphate-sugar epimerase